MHLAQITGITPVGNKFHDYNSLLGDVLSRALLFAITAAGFFFFYQLITSGVSYMTSSGDENRLKQIQKQLVNATFGLLIVIAAYFIIQMVQSITGANIL
jgi:hypothetical protein